MKTNTLTALVAWGITPSQNSVCNIALNGKYYFFGNSGTREVDEAYYNRFASNIKAFEVPVNLDPVKFPGWLALYMGNFTFTEDNYPKVEQFYSVITTNGNQIVFRNNPRQCLVLTRDGQLIRKDDAQWGNAREYRVNVKSLEEYADAILDRQAQQQAEKDKAEAQLQAKLSEMYQPAKGWYLVELRCCKDDHKRGGHKEHWTNWKILANSQMDAYNKAVDAAEAKGYYWFAEPQQCQIDFYGVWTDETEMYLREEGLIK